MPSLASPSSEPHSVSEPRSVKRPATRKKEQRVEPPAFQKLDAIFPMTPMDPKMKTNPTKWLAPGLLMEAKINVMFGPEKAGKSRLLAWILLHVLTGTPLWGDDVRKIGRVLYLLGEETQGDMIARLREYSMLAGIPYDEINWGSILTFCDASGMRLDHPGQRDWLEHQIDKGTYNALVVDPLRRVHGASESSNDEMSRIFNVFRDWTNQKGLTLVMVHHTGKLGPDDDEDRIATWSRGATDLPAVLDWATYVRRYEDKASDVDRVIVRRRGRSRRHDPLILWDYGEKAPGWSLTRRVRTTIRTDAREDTS